MLNEIIMRGLYKFYPINFSGLKLNMLKRID